MELLVLPRREKLEVLEIDIWCSVSQHDTVLVGSDLFHCFMLFLSFASCTCACSAYFELSISALFDVLGNYNRKIEGVCVTLLVVSMTISETNDAYYTYTHRVCMQLHGPSGDCLRVRSYYILGESKGAYQACCR